MNTGICDRCAMRVVVFGAGGDGKASPVCCSNAFEEVGRKECSVVGDGDKAPPTLGAKDSRDEQNGRRLR